jgi:hypothetical protein
MSYRLAPAMFVMAFLAFATAAHAQKTITVNFDSTAGFEESNGDKGTATKSTMTAAQRAKAIAVAQKEYDDALGAGKVVIKEGTGGDYQMTVSGGAAIKAGAKYGNAGKDGQTGIVYQGEFGGFTGDELSNGVGETIAHEAAHKIGIAGHNEDNPPSKMTRGDLVTEDQRKKDGRSFSASDVEKLKKNLGLATTEQKDDKKVGDLGIRVGAIVQALANKPDDDYLDAFTTFNAPVGASFGYISDGGDFVWQGDWQNPIFPGTFTFIYSAGANLAVQFGSQVYTLENGGGSFTLSDVNPFNPKDFRHADLRFMTAGGEADLVFDATVLEGTGGFYMLPEPTEWVLMLVGFAALGASLRARRGRLATT